MSMTDSTPVPAWRAPRALAIALLLVGDAMVLSLEPRSLVRAIAGQLLWASLAGVAAASALVRARRERRAFVGWNVLGLALAIMALATLGTVVEYLSASEMLPFPRLGDWLQVPGFAAMGFALLAWPLGSPSSSARLRTFLDATLFAVASFSIIWTTILWSVRRGGVPGAVWALLVAQFGIMAILFAIIAYLGFGAPGRMKGPVGWITAALACAMLATLAILTSGAEGTYYVGHWSDLSAGIPLVVFVLATVTPRPVTGEGPEAVVESDPLLFGGWLTYGSIGIAFAVSVWALAIERRNDAVLLGHGFAIIALLVLRQMLAVRDIRLLTTGLEAKVRERTRELEESQAALVRAARLEALGRLAGGVAHDFNNLLTGIVGYAEMIELESAEGDPRRGDAQEIRKSVERGARLTRQLLAFARKQPGHAVVLDPLHLVTDLQSLLRRLIGVDISLTVAGVGRPGHVRMDPGQLEQVIVNMALNARDAMPTGGTLNIDVADAEVSAPAAERSGRSGSFVRLRIRDSGVGMSTEVQARIFEPFYTTKDESKGTGLGLATSYGIVDQAGGFIMVESAPGKGTCFDVHLPRTDAAEQWTPSGGVDAGPGRGHETVLLAEDEKAVRELMAATLQAHGYTVLVAKDGEEAVAAAERHQGPIDLLLTDMIMPGMNGLAAAAKIAVMRPALRVLVVSGYMPDGEPHAGLAGQSVAHVAKPVTPIELARRVRAVLDETPRSG